MALPIRQRPNLPTKMNGNDRILKLKQRETGLKPTSPGLIGREVFTGGNNLHCVYDDMYGLWSFKLEHGAIPEGLKQQFTSFSTAFKHAKNYFDHKNIDVTEE